MKLSVNISAIEHNHLVFKQKTSSEIACVVKANCYGLGVDNILPTLEKLGTKNYFVATINEGINLRKLTSNNIYILNGFDANHARLYDCNNLIPVLNSIEQMAKHRGACVVHIDSGMTRLGVSIDEFTSANKEHLDIMFVMSHYTASEDGVSSSQGKIIQDIKKLGYKTSFANSSGVFLPDEHHGDIARIGAGIYGIGYHHQQLQNVINWNADILQIRNIIEDSPIGYGSTYIAKAGSRIATISAGYSHGYPRDISSDAYVIIAGQKAPIIGRISMDLITVDITGLEVSIDDKAQLLCDDIRVDKLAQWANKLDYEIITNIKW